MEDIDMNQMFPSKYLKGSELPGDTLVTIAGVKMQEVGKPPEMKPVMALVGSEKGMVLNRTNGDVIAKMYGPKASGWLGKKVTIYPTPVEYAGETSIGIRIRPAIPA